MNKPQTVKPEYKSGAVDLDELEKLARAALDPTFPWPDRDAMRQGLWQAVELEFIEKSTPAAILELISINRELVAAAEKLMAGLHKRIRDAKDETPIFTGISDMHNALIRANGENNE